ncbi:Zn-dependent hydrolase oxidoreductase family [Mycena venus]|uniref:Zn-dependent hydrolase oxidoreductase family n=1 Tax=Mycena venus TaxID=2733690 RepID=A0A8H6YG09_9AGAR|nr:Zn-dependent hydrolase oxidoreductase family [Mycena venus]
MTSNSHSSEPKAASRPVSGVPPSIPGSRLVRKHLDATRHEDFWFHDGSIVILVGPLMFRVHQTVLSTHSEVFAGLFILPQPPSGTKGQEMIEGCHVVQLHDNADDFVDMLKGIYNPSHFDTLPDELGDILTWISGMLRLSTKYMILSLRQRCISILKAKFPATFASYNAMISSPHRKHYKSDEVMRAVLLAQECNVREVLPYAYYCVARMGLTRLVSDAPADISWREKAVCLVGRERLRWAEMSLSHSFLFAFRPAPSCVTPQCALAHGPHKEWRVLEAARSPNPLKLFARWQALNVCAECVAHARTQHQAGEGGGVAALAGHF